MEIFKTNTSGEFSEKGKIHPATRVELYVPWNDTWIYLPDLPKIDEELIMSKTHIVSIAENDRGSALLLLGGTFVKRQTMSEETRSRVVWRLLWDKTRHSYSWTDQFDTKIGE